MSTNEPTAPEIQSTGVDHNQATTLGILSVGLALIAASGGGTLANAAQFWAYDLTSGSDGNGQLTQTIGALPALALGIGAILTGFIAARSPQVIASATGKAGIVLGAIAVLGSVLYVLTSLTSDLY